MCLLLVFCMTDTGRHAAAGKSVAENGGACCVESACVPGAVTEEEVEEDAPVPAAPLVRAAVLTGPGVDRRLLMWSSSTVRTLVM